MKNTLFLFLLLLSTSTLFAQKEKGTLSADLYFTPQFFQYFEGTAISEFPFDPIFSFSIGVAGDYQVSKRWAANVGLAFQNARERFDWSELRWGNQHNGNGGFDPSIPSRESATRNTRGEFYLEVPISGKYYFSVGNKRIYGRLGFQPEWLLGFRSVIESISDPTVVTKITSFDVPHTFNLSALIGAGLELDLGSQMAFFIEPEVKSNLLRGNSFLDTRKYLWGLRVGATWRFDVGVE